MTESTLLSLGDLEQPPWRRALRTVLFAAVLTPIMLLNADTLGWDGSLVGLAPALAAGAVFGLAVAVIDASAAASDWSRGRLLGAKALLAAAALVVSFVIANRWSTWAIAWFVLAAMWTNALADVTRHILLPQFASSRS